MYIIIQQSNLEYKYKLSEPTPNIKNKAGDDKKKEVKET